MLLIMTVSVRKVNLGKTDSFVLLVMTVSVRRLTLFKVIGETVS